MSLINIISVPTSTGLKTIEVHNQDITRLDWNVDILVVSAYPGKYNPAPGTVIKALQENKGIAILNLAENPQIDLRNPLGCWLSNSVESLEQGRILCIEGIKTSIEEKGGSEEALSNLFGTLALISHKNVNCSKIAMPLLGTGYQGNKIENVLPVLVEKAIHTLINVSSIHTIYFVEIDEKRVRLIDDTINAHLRRDYDKLESVFDDEALVFLFEGVISKLLQIKSSNNRLSKSNTLNNLISKISSKDLKFYELGILSRKTVEILVKEISGLPSSKEYTLIDHINELRSKKVANWMITYMHTLRAFGNSVAHEEMEETFPNHMEKADIFVFAHSFSRFLDFFLNFKEKKMNRV
jgi:hypothetical protein